MGLLILAGAALVSYPGKAPRPQDTASTARPPSSPYALPVPQEAAVAKAPAVAMPPGDASSAPAARGVPAPASRAPAAPEVSSREAPAKLEPALNSPRVVVHYREGAGAAADRFATALAGANPKFSHVEVRAVPSTPRAPTIRFFHPEDVGAAWELEAALSATGDTWQVRNFTSYQPRPRRGTLEVWLP